MKDKQMDEIDVITSNLLFRNSASSAIDTLRYNERTERKEQTNKQTAMVTVDPTNLISNMNAEVVV